MKDEQTGGDNICCCIGVIKRTRNMQLAQQVLQTSLLGLHFVRQGIYLFILFVAWLKIVQNTVSAKL